MVTAMSTDLTQLAELEQLARECTQRIAACLEPGMTEETVASLMRQWLHQHQCDASVHRPLAWFGNRSNLKAGKKLAVRPSYFPTDKRLKEGQSVVLYCAPRRGELVAESIKCISFGSNLAYRQLTLQLAHLKPLLLRAINQQQTVAELTHLVRQLASTQGASLEDTTISGHWLRPFTSQPDLGTGDTGILHKVVELAGSKAPHHLPASADMPAQDNPLSPGLWVLQPWLNCNSAGAGFRQLVYINSQGQAEWLTHSTSQIQAA